MAVGVDAVERALTILEAFKDGSRSMSLKEISEKTKLNKATILRLIVSLEKFNYITRLGEGRFSLGPTVVHLGSIYQRSFRISDHVQPILDNIVKETGETAAYFVREKDQRVCLFMAESPNTLRSHLREGDVRPLRPGGTGIVLQAFSGERGKEFDKVRNDLMSINIGERHPEIASIAVPVLRIGDQLAAALSISGPVGHFTEDRIPQLAMAVLKGAAALTTLFAGDASALMAKWHEIARESGVEEAQPPKKKAKSAS